MPSLHCHSTDGLQRGEMAADARSVTALHRVWSRLERVRRAADGGPRGASMLRAAGARRAGPDAELSFDCRPTVGARFGDGGLRGEMAADARSVTALGPPRLESARASETSSRRWTEGGVDAEGGRCAPGGA